MSGRSQGGRIAAAEAAAAVALYSLSSQAAVIFNDNGSGRGGSGERGREGGNFTSAVMSPRSWEPGVVASSFLGRGGGGRHKPTGCVSRRRLLFPSLELVTLRRFLPCASTIFG
jgi:hypothetical protein